MACCSPALGSQVRTVPSWLPLGVLEGLGIRQSVGDNALAESFNASLKVERLHAAARW
jgi:hypothetical protein